MLYFQAKAWRRLFASALLLVLLAAPLPARATGVPNSSLADLVANLLPSVVNVTTKRLVRPPNNTLNASSTVEAGGGTTSNTTVGSGFVVDPDGLIATNNHVVDGAYDVTATFNDGTILHAEVIATTKLGDLALIKVNSNHKLPALRWGDSSTVRVGDPVIAIGNPLGFGGSVSTGIVSALNRNIMLSPFDDFIQTDAALNHGNSGGPLFNLNGEVIGVTTALFTPVDAGGSIGIGFAIPAYCAEFVTTQLSRFGMVRAGELGVQLQDVTAEIAAAMGLPPTSRTAGILPGSAGWGVIVTNTTPDGPSAQSGISEGDILLRIDGQPIGDVRAFARTIAVHKLNAPVTVDLWRKGAPMTVRPVVREWLSGERIDAAALTRSRPVRSAMADLGLRLAPLTEAGRVSRDLAPGQSGVLVQNVVAGSIAGDRGLGSGDVIIKVMDQPVFQPDEVLSRLRDMWDQRQNMVLLLVHGANGLRWVPMPMPSHPG
jgi:serine protease Do